MENNKSRFLIVYIALLVTVLLRMIPYLFPETRTWGFNHLIFLPVIYSFFFILISLMALVFPYLKPAEKWGEALSDHFNELFFENRFKYLNRFIFTAIASVVFIAFSAPTHFLGDGYVLIQSPMPHQDIFHRLTAFISYKWSEVGIIELMFMIRSIVGIDGEPGAIRAFQIVSVLSGAVSCWFFFLIAQAASEDKLKRLLIFFTSFFTGGLLLFFGYAEFYPILWIFLLGFLYNGICFIRKGIYLGRSWLFFLIGALLHMQMFILLPAALFLSLANGRGLLIYQRFRFQIRGLIFVICTIAIIFFFYLYKTNLYFEDMFLPLFDGKPHYPEYAIFSLAHILDMLNEIILISPLMLPFLMTLRRSNQGDTTKRFLIFLFLAATGSLLFLLVVDPKLAMPRDWDLFSMSAYAGMIFLIISMSGTIQVMFRKFLISFILLLIISPVPYLLTNLNQTRSLEYFEYLLELDIQKGLSSLTVLKNYSISQGEPGRYEYYRRKYDSQNPDWNKYRMALEALHRGNLELGAAFLESAKPNKFEAEYHRTSARLSCMRGDLDKALTQINNAIQLRRYCKEYYWERGMIYMEMNKPHEYLNDLRRAYKFDTTVLLILDDLTFIHAYLEQYDSSIYYGEKLIAKDSSRAHIYYSLGMSHVSISDLEGAEYYNKLFGNLIEGDSTLIAMQKELEASIRQSKTELEKNQKINNSRHLK